MNAAHHGTIANAGKGQTIHPTYQAMLDFGTAQSYALPGAGVQTVQNTLVKGLVDEGLLFDHEFLYFFATDVDSAFARLNLARFGNLADSATFGTNLATKVGGITFTSKKGYKGDGVSGTYLDFNWNITTHRRRTTHGDLMFWAVLFDITGIYGPIGSNSNTAPQMVMRRGPTATSFVNRVYSGDNSQSLGVAAVDDDFLEVRSDATNTKVYKNGTEQHSLTTPAEVTTNNATGQAAFRYASTYYNHGIYAVGACKWQNSTKADALRNLITTAITQIGAL